MSKERVKAPSHSLVAHQTDKSNKTESKQNKDTARPFSAGHILQMQSTVGNQVVQNMLSAQMKKAGAPIQRMEGEEFEEEELQMKKASAPIQRMEGEEFE